MIWKTDIDTFLTGPAPSYHHSGPVRDKDMSFCQFFHPDVRIFISRSDYLDFFTILAKLHIDNMSYQNGFMPHGMARLFPHAVSEESGCTQKRLFTYLLIGEDGGGITPPGTKRHCKRDVFTEQEDRSGTSTGRWKKVMRKVFSRIAHENIFSTAPKYVYMQKGIAYIHDKTHFYAFTTLRPILSEVIFMAQHCVKTDILSVFRDFRPAIGTHPFKYIIHSP